MGDAAASPTVETLQSTLDKLRLLRGSVTKFFRALSDGAADDGISNAETKEVSITDSSIRILADIKTQLRYCGFKHLIQLYNIK